MGFGVQASGVGALLLALLFSVGDSDLDTFGIVETFDHPLFLITYPYKAHCMGACGAKGAQTLFSLTLSLLSLSPFNVFGV